MKPQGRLVIGMIYPDSPPGRAYETNKEKSKLYRQARFHRVPQVLTWLVELEYKIPEVRQTIFQDLQAITGSETMREGYGEGIFVVIAADRK